MELFALLLTILTVILFVLGVVRLVQSDLLWGIILVVVSLVLAGYLWY